jgi:lipopolysaccharide export system protein LptA
MRRIVKQLFFAVTLLVILCVEAGWPGASQAARIDQPITIEADRATINEKEGVSTYSGHVVLTQGDIKITAESVIVHQEQGQLTHITAIGAPVTYFQKGETAEQDIHGQANTMEYYATEQRLQLLDNARLSQGGNSFSGNQIDYDTQREVVTAAVSESGKQRVQVTIQPKTLQAPERSTDGKTPREQKP